MPDEEHRDIAKLASGVLHGPLDVRSLVLPARPTVHAALAPLVVQRRSPEASLVEAEHRYSAVPERAVDVLVSANVLDEPVQEYDDGFRFVRFICAGVELAVFGTAQPGFSVRLGHSRNRTKAQPRTWGGARFFIMLGSFELNQDNLSGAYSNLRGVVCNGTEDTVDSGQTGN